MAFTAHSELAAKLTTDNGPESYVLHPNIRAPNPLVVSAKGNKMHLSTGQVILDATGGPGVACIGHGDPRIRDAMVEQMEKFSFCHALFWGNPAAEQLAATLVESTGGEMTRAIIYCSGSEAVESALKLARQHYVNISQPTRTHFIARQNSFHGTTLAALGLSGQRNKRTEFEPLLTSGVSFVSDCHPYRNKLKDESSEEYCARLADELDQEFERIGGQNVCAFVAETVAGTSIGCVPPEPGYFRAIKSVCEKHGALLILDEVLCGMGRTGSLHAWEQEGIVPDISVVAKGLAAGYATVSALLLNRKLVDVFKSGPKFFNHGHTYQAHPVGCVAALQVQKIIKDENLVRNVVEMGKLLESRLKSSLASHPHVGDIRGRGLMWAIEIVQDKISKEPFPVGNRTAFLIRQRGLDPRYSISLQPGGGSIDGTRGDHIILLPAYTSTPEDIEEIVRRTSRLIFDFFEEQNLS
ncbi:aminotransferase class-III [Xylaria cf. heliscus]|nr:aminotransferase class-III [Xylaria cf. heliscus]